jgi:hypothetical protein
MGGIHVQAGYAISSHTGIRVSRSGASGAKKARCCGFTGVQGLLLDMPFGLNVSQRSNLAMTPATTGVPPRFLAIAEK